MSRRVPAVAVRVLFMIAAVVVTLGTSELILRTTDNRPDNFWWPDPLLGQVHIARKTGTWRSECSTAPITMNSWGFRGPEWVMRKSPGTMRVLVLGDSLVEGLQVPFDSLFTTLLERRLNAGPGHGSFEVLNFGVSGYGTGQNYLNLVHKGLQFEPDVVLLGFSVSTDVREDSRVLDGRRDRPYVRVEHGAVVVEPPDYPYSRAVVKTTLQSLHLYRALSGRLLTAPWMRPILIRVGFADPLSPELENEVTGARRTTMPWDFTVYAKRPPPAWETSWDNVVDLLAAMDRVVKSRGGRFIVFGIPSPVEIMSAADVETKYPGFEAGYDVNRPHERLTASARRYGFTYVSLRPDFGARSDEGPRSEPLHFPCDAHLTPAGHARVANRLFRQLASPPG